jgi:hypothetical protein
MPWPSPLNPEENGLLGRRRGGAAANGASDDAAGRRAKVARGAADARLHGGAPLLAWVETLWLLGEASVAAGLAHSARGTASAVVATATAAAWRDDAAGGAAAAAAAAAAAWPRVPSQLRDVAVELAETAVVSAYLIVRWRGKRWCSRGRTNERTNERASGERDAREELAGRGTARFRRGWSGVEVMARRGRGLSLRASGSRPPSA